MIENQLFVSAVNLNKHPIKNVKQILKTNYYYALKYYLDVCVPSPYIESRLKLYRTFLLRNDDEIIDEKKSIDAIVSCKFQPWRNKYKFWLICDLALITGDALKLQSVVAKMKEVITKRQGELIEQLVDILNSKARNESKPMFASATELIEQYRYNSNFFSSPEKRIIITANMSAGKSTLINAIIGTDLARTSQEVCTGNICYFYNTAFDDGTIHFKGKDVNYSSYEDEYKNFEWDSTVAFAAAFDSVETIGNRICLIDTPGVNSTIKREHGKISKTCITSEPYDFLLYVLNANKLGTDEEMAYLRWISKNVPAEKIIFVLNKLDDFKKTEDNIASSIEGVKLDLVKIGYVNPSIYPISAYFAYLLKKENKGKKLSDDEIDELELFKKKFKKKEYDLSIFYTEDDCKCDYVGFLKKSGLYYLEKKLYGGVV